MGQIVSGTLDGAVAFAAFAFLLTLAAACGLALLVGALPLVRRLMTGGARQQSPKAHDGPIPDVDVALISAAVAAMGPQRIIHIEPLNHGLSWQSQGRAKQHGSHAVHA